LQGIKFSEHSLTIRASSDSSRSGFILRPTFVHRSQDCTSISRSGCIVKLCDGANCVAISTLNLYSPATAPAPVQNCQLRTYMPSLFKTLGAVLCLVFALCFAAPNAVADEFVYTYTIPGGSLASTFTTDPIAAITAPTTILAADLASFSLTGSEYQGSTLSSLTFNFFDTGNQRISYSDGVFNFVIVPIDGYTLSDYSTPGTYTTTFGNILTVTPVTATPEPSSLALMLSGVGLVFAMRKRLTSGLQQAR
jgi:hypothetical protein